jgi:signal transduction histidine kinase
MKKFSTLAPEKVTEHLRRMDETSTHLVQLVNDFLNMSRLDMGRIEIVNSSFDIIALTDEILH